MRSSGESYLYTYTNKIDKKRIYTSLKKSDIHVVLLPIGAQNTTRMSLIFLLVYMRFLLKLKNIHIYEKLVRNAFTPVLKNVTYMLFYFQLGRKTQHVCH